HNTWSELTKEPGGTRLAGGDYIDEKTGEAKFSVAPGPRISDRVEDVVLRTGREVAIKFRAAPSRTWKDPAADILGLWMRGSPPSITRLAQPLKFQRH